jgi:hypothetical protein
MKPKIMKTAAAMPTVQKARGKRPTSTWTAIMIGSAAAMTRNRAHPANRGRMMEM